MFRGSFECRKVAGMLAVVAACVSAGVPASEYPTKPVRMVVPFAPGGATDIVARVLAQSLSETWGKPVVVDNRGGAGGVVGTETVAKAPPDGYTLLVGLQSTHAVNPAVYQDLSFDPIKDFAPVTVIAYSPQLLVVHPSVQAKTLKEFIALAKSAPGRMSFGSSGTGSSPHLAFELFMRAAGIKLVHVPYRGTGQVMVDLLGGQIQASIGGVAGYMPHVQSGKLRALAIASAKRSAALPQIPTMAETELPGFDVTPWFGLFYPAGTPKPIINKLFSDVKKILEVSDTKQKIAAHGAEAAASESPQQFAAYVLKERELWKKVVKEVMPVPAKLGPK